MSDTGRAYELLTALYAIHPTGGPLHTAVDDGNLDGVIDPHYSGWSDTDLDTVYFEGWPIADLPPEAPAVVEGLGQSTRQICDELAALLNAMPERDRAAVVDSRRRGSHQNNRVTKSTRVPWARLLPGERDAITNWVRAHQLDPARVPVTGLIEYDPVTREWRIEAYVVDDQGRKLINDAGDGLRLRVVRRADRGPLPWLTIGGPLAANRIGAAQ